MKKTTLWIMIEKGKIFLWEKKRGFAKWVLNWVWGKLEWSESIEECMIREAKEEIGIDIKLEDMDCIWILHFYFENNKGWNQSVYLYRIHKYSWKIIESDEIKPLWFDLDNLPYDKMWKDDIYWLPRILNWEQYVEYKFWFDKDNWELIKHELIK